MTFVCEELGEAHDLSGFDSGQPVLDGWLRGFARHAQANRTGRTFVWHAGDGLVVAYFTLAAHEVVKGELPARIGRGGPDRVPAALLARLALDRGLQGQGLGARLLVDALGRIIEAFARFAPPSAPCRVGLGDGRGRECRRWTSPSCTSPNSRSCRAPLNGGRSATVTGPRSAGATSPI